MANLKRDIRYINRDFNDFRNTLINYSKTYFPDTYNDFTETSTGMLFIEMASYVGDVLSFYIDNQIQETFIQTARQTENLFNLSYMLGYVPKVLQQHLLI
jgi:TnpA family transposase